MNRFGNSKTWPPQLPLVFGWVRFEILRLQLAKSVVQILFFFGVSH